MTKNNKNLKKIFQLALLIFPILGVLAGLYYTSGIRSQPQKEQNHPNLELHHTSSDKLSQLVDSLVEVSLSVRIRKFYKELDSMMIEVSKHNELLNSFSKSQNPSQSTIKYSVKRGDTLQEIIDSLNVKYSNVYLPITLQETMKTNNISDPAKIQVGLEITFRPKLKTDELK